MPALGKSLSRLRVIHGYAGRMGVAALIGIVGGCTAIAFHEALELAEHLVQFRLFALQSSMALWPRWAFALAPALGGLLCGLLVYTWAPEAAGQGVDALIQSFHHKGGHSRLRVAPIKFLASILTISSGGSGGYEGPVSQIGGALSSGVGRLFNMPRALRRSLMLAGTAAGLSAVFKAPLGGALTSVEMLYKEDFESGALVSSIVASVVAFAVYTSWAGTTPSFGGVPPFTFRAGWDLLAALLLGVLCAPFSRLFVWCYYRLDAYFSALSIPRPLKPAIGGLGVGLLFLAYPEVCGGNMGFVGEVMRPEAYTGGMVVLFLIALLLAKILATSLTVGSGGAGGLFGPSLFMGGVLGAAWAATLHWLFPGWLDQPAGLVLVGMGAFFAGAAKAPIAGVVMVCEMTGNYSLLPALLLSSIVHVVLSRRWSIYRSQVENKFASPVHRHEMDPDVLRLVRVGDVVAIKEVHKIQAHSEIASLPPWLGEADFHVAPVYQGERYMGLLDVASALRLLAHEPQMGKQLLASDFLLHVPMLHPYEDLHSCMRVLLRHGVQQACVGQHGHVTGLLSYADIVQAYEGLVGGRR